MAPPKQADEQLTVGGVARSEFFGSLGSHVPPADPGRDAAQLCGWPDSTGVLATDDIDSLLDEIDDVLETNSESFVRGFVQKGGQ